MKRRVLSWLAGLVFLSASPSFAQVPGSSEAPRFWFDFNAGWFLPADGDRAYTQTAPLFGEAVIRHVTYPWAGVTRGIDVAAGYLFRPRMGVGARFMSAFTESPASLAIVVPSPIFFNAFGADSASTDPLSRRERILDIFLAYDLFNRGRWQVRVSAGPTYGRVSLDQVRTVEYSQTFGVSTPLNVVQIESYALDHVQVNVWGVNAGVDLAWFVSPWLGLGGNLRVSGGRTTTPDPLSGEAVRVIVGGLTAATGLRFRF